MKQIYIHILTLALASLPQALSAQKTPIKSEQPKPLKKYTQGEIFELIKKAIKEGSYQAEKKVLTLQSSFVNELGFDSLDIVEFIMDMEKQFGIAIPDPAAEKIVTIQDAITVIDGILKKKK